MGQTDVHVGLVSVHLGLARVCVRVALRAHGTWVSACTHGAGKLVNGPGACVAGWQVQWMPRIVCQATGTSDNNNKTVKKHVSE